MSQREFIFTDLAWTKLNRLVADRCTDGHGVFVALRKMRPYQVDDYKRNSCRWLVGATRMNLWCCWLGPSCMVILLEGDGIVRECVTHRGIRQIHKLFVHWRTGNFRTTDWDMVEALRAERKVIRIGRGLMSGESRPRDRFRNLRDSKKPSLIDREIA